MVVSSICLTALIFNAGSLSEHLFQFCKLKHQVKTVQWDLLGIIILLQADTLFLFYNLSSVMSRLQEDFLTNHWKLSLLKVYAMGQGAFITTGILSVYWAITLQGSKSIDNLYSPDLETMCCMRSLRFLVT